MQRYAASPVYSTRCFAFALSHRDHQLLVLLARHEGEPMTIVLHSLVCEAARERGLCPLPADQHAQAQASEARSLEPFADKPRRTNNSYEEERREKDMETLSMVKDLVQSYHKQALDQAKVQFWVSVAGTVIGFLWIIYSAIAIDPAHIGTILKVLSGVAMDTIAFFFLRQASETRQRATELYDRLRSDSKRAQAVALVGSIEDERMRSVVKAQISLHMAGLQPSPIDLLAFPSYHTEGDS